MTRLSDLVCSSESCCFKPDTTPASSDNCCCNCVLFSFSRLSGAGSGVGHGVPGGVVTESVVVGITVNGDVVTRASVVGG